MQTFSKDITNDTGFITNSRYSNHLLILSEDNLTNLKKFTKELDNPDLYYKSINLEKEFRNKSIFISKLKEPTYISSFDLLNINSKKFKNLLERINCTKRNSKSKRPDYYIANISLLQKICNQLLKYDSNAIYCKVSAQDVLDYCKLDTNFSKNYKGIDEKYKFYFIEKDIVRQYKYFLDKMIGAKKFYSKYYYRDYFKINNYLFYDILNGNLDINNLISSIAINKYLVNEGTLYTDIDSFNKRIEQLLSSRDNNNINLAIDLLKSSNLNNLDYNLLKTLYKVYNKYLYNNDSYRNSLIHEILIVLGLDFKFPSKAAQRIDPLRLAFNNIKMGNKKLLPDVDLMKQDLINIINKEYYIEVDNLNIKF